MRPGRSSKLRALGIGAAIAVGASLGVLAPAAVAAAPANDTLAGRTPLTGSLPLEVAESNAGATSEAGEFISPSGFPSGHSVWWEWEAPRTEVVSIGSCGSDFTTKVGVFTGEEFPLQPVPGSTGPECSAQKTFAAVAGTRYVIGVDGDSFYVPGYPRPSGEGTIALRVAAVPPPPNDAFAAPGSVQQLIWVLPGGNRMMMGSTSGGYNWGATKEPGEPVHAGLGGGVSIWYRFIAPGAGMVTVGASAYEGRPLAVLGVYTGSAVSALTPVAASASSERPVSFQAEAGQEFRIAVDGQADAEGAPWMGNVDLVFSEMLPPGIGNASDAPEYDTATAKPRVIEPTAAAPPDPPLVKGRTIDSHGRTASIRFASTIRGAHFRCSLDRSAFRACRSPLHLRHLHPGSHRLGIVTVVSGQPASAPSVVHFRIAALHRGHHQAG